MMKGEVAPAFHTYSVTCTCTHIHTYEIFTIYRNTKLKRNSNIVYFIGLKCISFHILIQMKSEVNSCTLEEIWGRTRSWGYHFWRLNVTFSMEVQENLRMSQR